MCNHTYTADYSRRPRSMGVKCPWPDIFEKYATPGDPDIPSTLPLDRQGECIFHSRELEWKRNQGFAGWFARLLQLLQTEDRFEYYDFAEFVFVGEEPEEDDGSSREPFRVAEANFEKMAYFTAASFVDPVELRAVDFADGASFRDATFARDLAVRNVRCVGLDATGGTFAGSVLVSDAEIRTYAIFDKTRFCGHGKGFTVKFEDCRFKAITSFSGAEFDLGDEATAGFVRVQFLDVVDFKDTVFRCQAIFTDVTFASTCDFIDTLFDTVRSSARYRGAAVEFNRLRLTEQAILVFKSTDRRRKLFNHDVKMSFDEEPSGLIQFENVNYNQLTPASKDRLDRLAKAGKVEIGPGCIKYRIQTELRTIPVSEGNSSLVLELCQTFTNYFTVSNGLSLGFEVVDRSPSKVSFFYFTDEDISEETFFDRLARTERRLWNLLSVRPEHSLLALESAEASTPEDSTPEDSTQPGRHEDNAVIHAVDAISALLGTFFRAGARIAFGAWTSRDTRRLLEAIQFNEEGAEARAQSLHQVIVDKYTGQTLFGINRQQNELLVPMAPSVESGKVKILFLGANSKRPYLGLDEEVKKLQTNLKLSRERDHLELKQEWAVTVDSLTQALLDESPRIVHFAGHGDQDGIILQEDGGEPKVVSAKALSRLFRLFADSIHCVVLNSCFSEFQAQAIREHIPYVIGMSSSLSDRAAIAFSTGFYKAIGAGKEIEFAYEMGLAAMELEGSSGESPVLLEQGRAS